MPTTKQPLIELARSIYAGTRAINASKTDQYELAWGELWEGIQELESRLRQTAIARTEVLRDADRVVDLLKAAQAALAKNVVPEGTTDKDCILELLGLLDDRKVVALLLEYNKHKSFQ